MGTWVREGGAAGLRLWGSGGGKGAPAGLRLWGPQPSPPAQPAGSPVVGTPYGHPGVVPRHLVYVPLGENAGSGTWGSRQG